MKQLMTPRDIQLALAIDTDTLAKLETYVDLLRTWQEKMNLVSASSLANVWKRHIFDSAQLLFLFPNSESVTVVDLGSGAGFPGLVLAIAGKVPVTMIESNRRKCAFLEEVARATESTVTIVNQRIENVSMTRADIVTARACAPLTKLLGYAAPFLQGNAIALFLKGRSIDDELTHAAKTWTMHVDRIPSRSDPLGVVLRIHTLAKRSMAGVTLDR